MSCFGVDVLPMFVLEFICSFSGVFSAVFECTLHPAFADKSEGGWGSQRIWSRKIHLATVSFLIPARMGPQAARRQRHLRFAPFRSWVRPKVSFSLGAS